MPESVEYIGARAFDGCINLKTVVVGNAVKTIESGAFGTRLGAKTQIDVLYKGTAEEWEQITTSQGAPPELYDSTVFFYSETAPEKDGNFWRYVGGTPQKWQ